MRRILSAMLDVRKVQLQKAGLEARFGEVETLFRSLDHQLSGITPTDAGNVLEEIMTTADFQNALVTWIQRQMWEGYKPKVFNFEPLVKPDTLPNFLPVQRYQRRAGLDDLEYVGEKGSAREGSIDDATKRQYQVYKWEKVFDFSMEALVNDDLGYFSDTASEMGRAARRTLEKYVSRFYTNAVTIARLIALGALYSTTGRLTAARIANARMAFNQRLDDRGEPVMASLVYIVHHSGLVDQVATIQASQLLPGTALNDANVVRNTFIPIEDPYIPGTAPNLPWYAFTQWNKENVVPFVLARRVGIPAPLILRKRSDVEAVASILGSGTDVAPVWGDFTTGNIQIKVYDEWGTYIDAVEGNMFDNRGAYYSDGTAA